MASIKINDIAHSSLQDLTADELKISGGLFFFKASYSKHDKHYSYSWSYSKHYNWCSWWHC